MLRSGRLVLEDPGEPYYWLFASSRSRFFLRTDETEIEFVRRAGRFVEMVIHNSDGSTIRCPRVGAGVHPS